MNKALSVISILTVVIYPSAEIVAADSPTPSIRSAAELIERVLPGRGNRFVIETIPTDNGKDIFEIESKDGKIVLRGNSALSIAVALNEYLKTYCHCSVSLNGSQLNVPDPLPIVPLKVRMTGWASARYLINYVTYGYVQPWWDWAQWEPFIDWMALNGVNMPLAITGQEAVWQAVGRQFGMTDAEIDAFLPGAPYLPFCWMGCLDSHGGPLPKEWIPQHLELGQKILARERELGMTPILQGFTGHIPEAILKKNPEAKAQMVTWPQGKGHEFSTWMLSPTDSLFQRFADAFMEEQTKLFGTDHLYDADSFIEMTPPSGDATYLANVGRAIYQGMAKTDPQAVWVIESWPFFHGRKFWSNGRIKALLDAVPDDNMLVLDLYCEKSPVWNKTEGFFGKPWVWSWVYNFGDRVEFPSAALATFNTLDAARRHPLGKNLKGVGVMMEGYGHDPMIFDLMYELAWREGIEDIAAWMKHYLHYRYGTENPHVTRAWDRLLAGPYARSTGGYARMLVVEIPSDNPPHVLCPEAAPAWGELLKAAPDLGQAETYRHDLVFIARQALNDEARVLHGRVLAAERAKDDDTRRQAVADFMGLLSDLDELLGTDPHFLLGPWLEDAKRWGATDAERAKLEWNARRILTLWGTGARIRDYSRREWSGMISGFYAERWQMYFDKKPPAQILQFEDDWASRRKTYPTTPKGDTIAVARRLYDKYFPTVHSLTTGKPSTCSSALPGMDASLANDGQISTERYWGTDAAKDPATWWQVDFEQPTNVGRVVVVGYYGDARHYGFTVEGSLDGQKWNMLADRRDNTAPSTNAGYDCTFTPRDLRYLRVTQTSNSANTGRHLVEVMAFEK